MTDFDASLGRVAYHAAYRTAVQLGDGDDDPVVPAGHVLDRIVQVGRDQPAPSGYAEVERLLLALAHGDLGAEVVVVEKNRLERVIGGPLEVSRRADSIIQHAKVCRADPVEAAGVVVLVHEGEAGVRAAKRRQALLRHGITAERLAGDRVGQLLDRDQAGLRVVVDQRCGWGGIRRGDARTSGHPVLGQRDDRAAGDHRKQRGRQYAAGDHPGPPWWWRGLFLLAGGRREVEGLVLSLSKGGALSLSKGLVLRRAFDRLRPHLGRAGRFCGSGPGSGTAASRLSQRVQPVSSHQRKTPALPPGSAYQPGTRTE